MAGHHRAGKLSGGHGGNAGGCHDKRLQTEKIEDLLRQEGMEVVAATPQEFATTLRSEIDRWRKLIKTAGIQVD